MSQPFSKSNSTPASIPNEDEILKFFESKVNSSGQSLESKVENIIKSKDSDHTVFPEVVYLDKDEKKAEQLIL